MERTKIVRGLRKTVSAACVAVCLLQVGLLVRSYSRRDLVWARYSRWGSASIAALQGKLRLSALWEATTVDNARWTWGWNTIAAEDAAENLNLSHIQSRGSTAGFELVNFPNPFAVAIPIWFPTLLAAGTAWVCSLGYRQRYSLRALLVAMTLIAVVLAMMAYLRVW